MKSRRLSRRRTRNVLSQVRSHGLRAECKTPAARTGAASIVAGDAASRPPRRHLLDVNGSSWQPGTYGPSVGLKPSSATPGSSDAARLAGSRPALCWRLRPPAGCPTLRTWIRQPGPARSAWRAAVTACREPTSPARSVRGCGKRWSGWRRRRATRRPRSPRWSRPRESPAPPSTSSSTTRSPASSRRSAPSTTSSSPTSRPPTRRPRASPGRGGSRRRCGRWSSCSPPRPTSPG